MLDGCAFLVVDIVSVRGANKESKGRSIYANIYEERWTVVLFKRGLIYNRARVMNHLSGLMKVEEIDTAIFIFLLATNISFTFTIVPQTSNYM